MKYLWMYVLMILAMAICANAETAYWDYTDECDYFELTLVSDVPDEAPIVVTDVASDLRTVPVTGLIAGRTYSFTMKAFLGDEESPDSEAFIYVKKPPTPDAPIYIDGVIMWDAVPGHTGGYLAYYREQGAAEFQSIVVSAGQLQARIPDVECSKTYEAYVVTVANGIEGDPSEIITATAPLCPPTNVRVIFE